MEKDRRKKLAHSLRVCRIIRCMRSGEVAQALGITYPHMSELESGQRPIGDLLVPWQEAVGWRPEVEMFVGAVLAGHEIEIAARDGSKPEG